MRRFVRGIAAGVSKAAAVCVVGVILAITIYGFIRLSIEMKQLLAVGATLVLVAALAVALHRNYRTHGRN